jgi:hypothetical protein
VKILSLITLVGGLVAGAFHLHQQDAAPVGARAGVVAINAALASSESGRTRSALDCAASPTCTDP